MEPGDLCRLPEQNPFQGFLPHPAFNGPGALLYLKRLEVSNWQSRARFGLNTGLAGSPDIFLSSKIIANIFKAEYFI